MAFQQTHEHCRKETSFFVASKEKILMEMYLPKRPLRQGHPMSYSTISIISPRQRMQFMLTIAPSPALQATGLAYHRKQFDIPVIGLTGSNGKTTSKELIHSVLSQQYRVHATKGNLNNHIGVPLTLLGINNVNTQIALIEMGANHQKEIAFLSELATANHGVYYQFRQSAFGGFWRN